MDTSGGSIAHINIENNFPDKDSAWDMLNYIAKNGVMYFAFNSKINECKNHHGFVGTNICPECGEPVFDTEMFPGHEVAHVNTTNHYVWGADNVRTSSVLQKFEDGSFEIDYRAIAQQLVEQSAQRGMKRG